MLVNKFYKNHIFKIQNVRYSSVLKYSQNKKQAQSSKNCGFYASGVSDVTYSHK